MKAEFEGYLKKYREQIFERNEKYIPLKKIDFMLFFESGDRLTYEKKYFAGRKALTVRALRVILGDDATELVRIIENILAEPVWALPAHCGKEAWDTRKYGIDLFAAETAGSLAEILFLVRGKFDGETQKRLEEAFWERFKSEIIEKWEKDKPWWEEGNTNWTSVCVSNIGIALFYLWKMGYISEEKLAEENDRIERSLYTYIDGFGSDGCCLEGISYYNYGMQYLTALLELWEGAGICKVDTAKIKSEINKRNISSFLSAIYLGGKKFVAFSDTTGNEQLNLGLVAYLSSFDKKLILPKEYTEAEGYKGFETLGGEECGRFALALREYIWVEKYADTLRTGFLPREALFKEAEWYIARFKNGVSFAIKGGNNKEPHNHNDVGNFMVSYRGIPVIAELGSGEYTADYFGEKRYEYLCASSKGHNVPVCAGLYQQSDTEGGQFSFEEGVFTKDLSPSYGLKSGSVIRKAVCKKEGEIHRFFIEDRSDTDITETLMFFERPKISEDNVKVSVKPEGLSTETFTITFENTEKPSCEELSYKTHDGKTKKVYRVLAKKKAGCGYIALSFVTTQTPLHL